MWIYDYGRVGADGKPRELHIDKALDVTKLVPPAKYEPADGLLASCEYFQVECLELGGAVCDSEPGAKDAANTGAGDMASFDVDQSSFLNILAVDGCATITADATGQNLELAKGESLFIPAGLGIITLSGTAKLILTRIPKA